MRAQRSDSTDPTNTPKQPPSEGAAVLIRLGWMVAGPLTMLVSGFTIASKPQWTFGPPDLALAFGACVALALRYWDIEICDGRTADGEPASMAVYRRYALGLSATAVVVWAAAQSVWL